MTCAMCEFLITIEKGAMKFNIVWEMPLIDTI